MSVAWAATALETGWFSGLEKHSDVETLEAHLDELRTRGQGYLEIRLPDSDLPYLALGFQGDHAVLHLFDEAGGVALLFGDGTAAADTEVEVMAMNELAVFTGDFVLSVDHAWDVVRGFFQAGVPDELGEWWNL